MKQAVKVVVALMLIASMAFSLMACSGNKGDENTYTIWIATGENATYYSDYNDNPAIKYWNSLQYKGKGGELVDVEMDFESGVAGQAESFFNTMIATWDDQYDVIDLSQGAYSAAQLYEEEILIDLTPYIEAGAMPNYVKWLEQNPDYALTATNLVDGEPKYLQLYYYSDNLTPWGGWQYRRDWIVKYGKNPSTGEAFTGGYDTDGNWSDDIIFPSWYKTDLKDSYIANVDPDWDGTVPVFISDWEWMLDIFATAIEDQGLTDGYAMSLWYPGYMENGTILTGFGGGSAGVYKDGSTIKFGGTSDNFKAYLQCMNQWYKNGWINQNFTDHSSDAFYMVDTVNMFSGNVGLFYSTEATTATRLQDPDFPATEGAYVAALREPINDIYGSGEPGGQKYVPGVNEFIPDNFYQVTKESISVGLTTSLINNDKDIYALLSALDYLYEVDGGTLLVGMGLTAEQYATVAEPGDIYERFGLTETGTYYKLEEPNGPYNYSAIDAVIQNSEMSNPCKINHFIGLKTNDIDCIAPESIPVFREWLAYEATGQLLTSFTSQLSPGDSKTYTSVTQNIRDYSYGEIPKFIMGTNNFESDWDNYCKQVKRYGYENVVNIFQALLNQFSDK